MAAQIRQAVELLHRSAYTIALTGAGISTPSGIPDFRSPVNGLWSTANPLEVASIWAFVARPATFYEWFRPLVGKFQTAKPNLAHQILAEMEAGGRLSAVITQNIDSLHQAAGSRRVVELHGHTRTATCLDCGSQWPADGLWSDLVPGADPPRCPECRGLVKPDVILFGEPLPYEAIQAAQQEALHCEVMLVIGTSLEVMPAADLPLLARRRGARTILINLTRTDLDHQFDLVLHADVIQTLQKLWQALPGS
jgi:NAD-dependent deacetylase